MTEPRITFRCLEIIQPIGTFYIGVIDAADLVAISYADVRTLQERDIERYLGIQRTLSAARVTEIGNYVNTVDATFPTAVILAVSSDFAEFNEQLSVMSLTRHDSVAKIIDGQHRIAGLKHYKGGTFLVNVAIFIDMDIEDQANVFATINLSQTKVSKSLAYDLLEYARHRSPQKTAHNAARVLNREQGSPFHHKIKVLGRATPGITSETLTQAAFVEALLPYITTDKLKDRDLLQRGQQPERASRMNDPRFLRNAFLDERDADIVLLLWAYFDAVRRRWPSAWNEKEAGNILNRTTGFSALMKFLPAAVASRQANDPTAVSTEYFETLLSAVQLRDQDFTPEQFPPGGTGTSQLYKRLLADTEGIRSKTPIPSQG